MPSSNTWEKRTFFIFVYVHVDQRVVVVVLSVQVIDERDLLFLRLFKYRKDVEMQLDPRNDDVTHVLECFDVDIDGF